jgi:hypothetical protein
MFIKMIYIAIKQNICKIICIIGCPSIVQGAVVAMIVW